MRQGTRSVHRFRTGRGFRLAGGLTFVLLAGPAQASGWEISCLKAGEVVGRTVVAEKDVEAVSARMGRAFPGAVCMASSDAPSSIPTVPGPADGRLPSPAAGSDALRAALQALSGVTIEEVPAEQAPPASDPDVSVPEEPRAAPTLPPVLGGRVRVASYRGLDLATVVADIGRLRSRSTMLEGRTPYVVTSGDLAAIEFGPLTAAQQAIACRAFDPGSCQIARGYAEPVQIRRFLAYAFPTEFRSPDTWARSCRERTFCKAPWSFPDRTFEVIRRSFLGKSSVPVPTPRPETST